MLRRKQGARDLMRGCLLHLLAKAQEPIATGQEMSDRRMEAVSDGQGSILRFRGYMGQLCAEKRA